MSLRAQPTAGGTGSGLRASRLAGRVAARLM